ncbi:phage tail assembly chaperone [Tropicibacter sp. R15_0]|uniref:rcc01693 family protein n=1 Tax=Tropicibacter sp. R15_0 TaxID=2821101 RepID=UPI001ADBFC02|nr:rcc01693 family protein [Tropicibacter sp. R15_0]MBO9464414.1 phage tail assembly chaperone [Tropicibacter sp. R15_0]
MKGFDWPVLMRAGMRGLGLRPREFWDLTPAELQMLLGEGEGGQPMGRSQLNKLMDAFPDVTVPQEKEMLRNERD